MVETARDDGSDERRMQEPCIEWTRDGNAIRHGGGATRGNATTSWWGKQEAEAPADKRWWGDERASTDAMQAGSK